MLTFASLVFWGVVHGIEFLLRGLLRIVQRGVVAVRRMREPR